MKYISNLISILFFISSILSQNILTFEYLGGDSLLINLINEKPVAGFEFNISDINIMEASGGLVETNEFIVSTSESTVIGFSITGASIQAGTGHMVTLFFDPETTNETPCFNLLETCGIGAGGQPCTFLSDVNSNYMTLNWDSGECVSGCFDNSACNSLNAEDCIYAMIYYQDIDNDLMGNELISQMYCDDEIPESGWVLGPDDGGDIFDIDGGEECPEDTPADCSGVCGGDAIVDECDICGGNGPEENYDCDGNCISTVDECAVCGGSGPEGNYDCDGQCTQLLDLNGVCCDFSDADCNGICGGTEIDEDEDGVCDDIDTCIEEVGASQECGCNAGLTEGTCDCDDNILDECGECGGGGIDDGACDCDGNITDCAGECGGLAEEDVCGECGGGETDANNCLSIDTNYVNNFSINNIYPNPFNPVVNIEYSVPNPGVISLDIIGLDGQIISTLINGFQAKGNYSTLWSPKNISSGVYLLQLKSNKSIYNKKIVYLK